MKKKILTIFIATVMLLGMVGCKKTSGGSESSGSVDSVQDVRLITVGWINSPVRAENDPFLKYIRDKYKINLILEAYDGGNFETQLNVALASKKKPDLICFSNYAQFEMFYADGSLVDDWGHWESKIPNVIGEMKKNKAYSSVLSAEGKPKTLFGNSDDTWTLKVRQDWLNDYAEKTIGYNSTENGDYKLKNSQDMLSFARWVKTTKNENGGEGKVDVYAFTSSGKGTEIGTSIEWTQGLFGHTVNGLANDPANGFYITDSGEVSNPIIDGSYKKWLDFMRTLVSENLITPGWFTQSWSDKQAFFRQEKVAFEYYPGSIAQEIYFSHKSEEKYNYGEDCIEWYQNMEMPKDDGVKFDGMPEGVNFGHIWTVTYAASLNSSKMDKICSLLNDVIVTYDETKTDKEYFKRSETYDAIRWGKGILDSINYTDIPGSMYVMCDTSKKDFRTDNPGSYDYGSWFSTANDGVAQMDGGNKTAMTVAAKVGQLNMGAQKSRKYFVPGSLFVYDRAKLTKMFDEYVSFTYRYATGKTDDADGFINKWRNELEGDKMIAEAKKQYKEMGYIK